MLLLFLLLLLMRATYTHIHTVQKWWQDQRAKRYEANEKNVGKKAEISSKVHFIN